MAEEQSHKDIRVLIRLAAISVPEERVAALAAGLRGMRTVAAALAKYEYGALEPACRWMAPGSRDRG